MSSSLEELTNNLPNNEFKYTSEVLKNEKLNLMIHGFFLFNSCASQPGR